jgi:hypothetical protein
MYLNFVAIDGVIKNQINTQEDATLKGKKWIYIYYEDGGRGVVDSGEFLPLFSSRFSFPSGSYLNT